jgi:mitosis inhibitor protein kinase SWE1
MLASSPSQRYTSPFSRDPPFTSPLMMTSTPPRFQSANRSSCYSPAMTPSPLKAHSMMDTDDLFSSPSTSRLVSKRGPDTTPPRFSAHSNSAPLRTPMKDTESNPFHFPGEVPRHTDAGVGAKRKPTPLFKTTPLRKPAVTPLKVTSAAPFPTHSSIDSFSFDRLAPLSAPRFSSRTPQTRADTEHALRRQAETMTGLRIGNLAACAGDSDSDLDQPKLLLDRNDGIATNVSPGGHVSKRRVRSKPSSSVLLEDLADSPFIVHVSLSSVQSAHHSASRLLIIVKIQHCEAANKRNGHLPLSWSPAAPSWVDILCFFHRHSIPGIPLSCSGWCRPSLPDAVSIYYETAHSATH